MHRTDGRVGGTAGKPSNPSAPSGLRPIWGGREDLLSAGAGRGRGEAGRRLEGGKAQRLDRGADGPWVVAVLHGHRRVLRPPAGLIPEPCDLNPDRAARAVPCRGGAGCRVWVDRGTIFGSV
jgi:hypothetical protein